MEKYIVITFIFTLLIFNIAVLIFLSREQTLSRKFFSPFGFFMLFYSFVFYFVPIVQLLTNNGRFDFLIHDKTHYFFYSSLLAFFYQLSAVVAFFVIKRPKINTESLRYASSNYDISSRNVAFFCFFIFIIGYFFISQLLLNYLGSMHIFMLDRINILSGYGYPLKMLSFSLPLIVLLFLRCKGRVAKPGIIILFIFSFLIFNLVGSRTNAVIAIPYLFLAYLMSDINARVKRLLIFRVLFLFILLLMLMGLLSDVRESFKVESSSINHENRSSLVASSLDRFSNQLFTNYGHNELLALVVERKDFFDYSHGMTFFAGFVSFIPRAIWSDKPLGGGPMLTNIIVPGSYSLGGNQGNTSYTTGLLIESFLNFSVLGVVFVGFFHGLIIALITRFTNNVVNCVDFFIFICLTHYFSIVFVTGEFLGVFSSFVFMLIPLFILNKLRFK